MNKPVIVWDVDDVLNELTAAWYQKFCGEHKTPYSKLTANPPHEVLGIPLDEYLTSLDDFRSHNLNSLIPRPEVLEWFVCNGNNYRHIALTAVPIKFAHLSAQWVLKNFSSWIRSYHFIPSPRPDDSHAAYDWDKTAFLKRLDRVDLFIDDSEKNVAPAEQAGFRCARFPQPWNRNKDLDIAIFLNNI